MIISWLNQTAELGGLPALTFLILFFFAIREGYNLIIWGKGLFDDYHKRQDDRENRIETIQELEERFGQFSDLDQKVNKLDKAIDEHTRSLNKLWGGIEQLQSALKKVKDDQDAYTLASCRSILYDLHKQGTAQGYTDQAAFETFEALKHLYIELGGNSVFKKRLIGEYEALPIRGIGQEEKNGNDT